MLYNKDLRKEIAWMTWYSKEGHIPSAYSILDIVTFLYDEFLNYDFNDVNSKHRDYFILSKGHGCSALYVVLKKKGLISQKDLEDKNKQFGKLATHPDTIKIPGVETSTGSLGNGLGFALGVALGLKIKKKTNKVIAIIGDGESNAGIVWECSLLASHLKLGNLCVILDYNRSCDPILPLPNPKKKWDSFGWNVKEVQGHNIPEIKKAMTSFDFSGDSKPKMLVANTIKGKGVKDMENNYGLWHSKVPNELELKKIQKDIDNYE